MRYLFALILFFQCGFALGEPNQSPRIENKVDTTSSENRETYLKWHKRFAYLTLALAAATVSNHEEKKAAKESHKTLGMATALSFYTSTYFGWNARNLDKPETQNLKFHRYLGYAAIPLMILLPISGIDADKDYRDGHDADGIGKMKGPLTGLTLATLFGSTALTLFEF